MQFRIGQRITQLRHPGFVDFGDVRMNIRHIRRHVLHARQYLGLLPLQVLHPRLHAGLIHAILNGGHDTGNAAFDLGKRLAVDIGLRAAFTVLMVQFLGVGAHGFGDIFSRNQLFGEARKNALFNHIASNGAAIVARTAPVAVETAIAISGDDAIVPVAAATGQQAGEQKRRATQAIQLPGAIGPHAFSDMLEFHRNFPLPLAHRLPQLIINDTQVWHFRPDPVSFRVDAGDAPARLGVLDIAQPVPDHNACVKLVVNDASAAIDMAANGRVAPIFTGRAGDMVAIEVSGDSLGALAIGEFTEDAPDDGCLGLIDLALAADGFALAVEALDHIITIAKPTTCLALLHPPAQAAMGLGGEVLEEQRIHRALEADMQFGDFSLGQRDDFDTGELQVFEQDRYIGLIATNAIKRLRQHDLELTGARILQQRLNARTQGDAGTGNGGVLIGTCHLPIFPRRLIAADAELIVDGRHALHVGGIAGVERDRGHRVFPFSLNQVSSLRGLRLFLWHPLFL